MVGVVGVDVQHHVHQHFEYGGIIEAGGLERIEFRDRHVAAVVDDATRQPQYGGVACIRRLGVARRDHLVAVEAEHASDRGVGGETVAAVVAFADHECDLFALARIELAAAGDSRELQVGIERHWCMREGAQHVGHNAQLLLDRIELGAGLGVDGFVAERRNVGHGSLRSGWVGAWGTGETLVVDGVR